MIRDKLPLAVVVALSLAAAWLFAFRPPVALYPKLKVEAPGPLQTNFLFKRQIRAASCRATAANVAAAIQTACPACRVVEERCVSVLSADDRDALAAVTLAIPSARLPNGVVTYSSPDPALALAACRESERAAKSNPAGKRVTCYPAGELRPSTGFFLPGGPVDLGLALMVLVGTTSILWIGPFAWLRRKHGAQLPPQPKRNLAAFGLLVADLTGWLAAMGLTWIIVGEGDVRRSVYHLVAVLGVLLFGLQVRGLYSRRRPFLDEARLAGRTFVLAGLADATLLFVTQTPVAVGELFTFWVLAPALCLALRILARWGMKHAGAWQLDTIIVGTGDNAREAAAALIDQAWMGMRVAGFLPLDGEPAAGKSIAFFGNHSAPVLEGGGAVRGVENTLEKLALPQVVVAMDDQTTGMRASLVQRLGAHYPDLYVVPALRGVPLYGLEATHFYRHEVLMLNVRNNLARWIPQVIKRLCDILGSIVALLLLSPILIYVTWSIRREDGSPAIFSQKRVGKDGREFSFYKFRSMVKDADAILMRWKTENPVLYDRYVKSNFKLSDDPRILGIGKWIRRTSIDELPQLWNVLVGDMSLVGPRPLLARELDSYGDNIGYYKEVRPGITGLWQVSGRSRTTFLNRSALDAWYVRNWSLGMDAMILLRTISVVIRHEGAF